jgi:hypothetical protein
MKSPYLEIGKLYTLDDHSYKSGINLTPIGSQFHKLIHNNTPMMLVKCDDLRQAIFLIEDKLYDINLHYVVLKNHEL